MWTKSHPARKNEAERERDDAEDSGKTAGCSATPPVPARVGFDGAFNFRLPLSAAGGPPPLDRTTTTSRNDLPHSGAQSANYLNCY